jgi:hypothetical protein
LLLRLNYDALKRIKEFKHDNLNITKIKLVNNELLDKLYESKRLLTLSEYRLKESQKTNFVLLEKYNLLKEEPYDIPKTHHRYFMMYPSKLPLYEFNEN